MFDINAGRQLTSWVGGFLDYTEGMTSPSIFRRWSAISALAMALERKVWILSEGRILYPNLYVFLCGPPGTGKSNAFHAAQKFWKKMEDHRFAPTDLSKASFVDSLDAATRTYIEYDISFNALNIDIGELGALLPGYDAPFMNLLTYLYDSEPFEERKRTKDTHIKVDNPCVNILAGTTPSFLNSMLPIGAWDQGFMARVIIVFSDEVKTRKVDLSATAKAENAQLRDALINDILIIGKMFTRMSWTETAVNALTYWAESGDLDVNEPLSHPRLQHYNVRRYAHLLKLCMIATADRGSIIIDLCDFQTAVSWLTEVETFMPDVFKAMTSGGEFQVMAECHHYLKIKWAKDGKPIPKTFIHGFLQQRLPPHSVERAYSVMVKSGMFVEAPGGGVMPMDTPSL